MPQDSSPGHGMAVVIAAIWLLALVGVIAIIYMVVSALAPAVCG